MGWTREQKVVVVASFLGWTLDAFDFFLMVFMFKAIAGEFNTDIKSVSYAVTLTLMARPVGALLFGRLADRFGRRPILMLDVGIYSLMELLSGFAPNLTALLILRTLFGVAMGGEWGIGASLTMESIPAKSRGLVSGLLQAGYPTGYLLASIVYGALFDEVGWRIMFMIGVLPALLVLFIRRNVPESKSWQEGQKVARTPWPEVFRRHGLLAVYAILLMTAFNFFSHGTQDLYPTFLQKQHGFDTHTVSLIAITYNIGAILGGLFFGRLSERIGRRNAITIAALIALPVTYLWAYSTTPVMLAIGAFCMQVSVQGAWGVIPVHLNELSPVEMRATFPGLVYQLGNLLASYNITLQSGIAEANNDNYSMALALVVVVVAIVISVLIRFSPERRGQELSTVEATAPS